MTEPAVALIGLGKMGLPMAERLIAGGYDTVGFDASPDAASAAAEAGVPVADSLRAAVGDDRVIVLMLPNSSIVESVLRELDGVLQAGRQVVDMSSSDPLRTRELATALAEAGVVLIDAPVSGGVSGARGGTLTVMAGGDPSAVERLTPMLSRFGRVIPVGPVGAGHAIKALNNLLSATHLWITSEAVLGATEFGIDPDVALAVFNSSSGRSGSSERKWPDFIRTGRYDSGFALQLMLKDVGIAADLLESLGHPSAVAAATRERWAAAAAELPPTADHTEIARYLESGRSGT